jgi:hypothetical protein
MGALWSHVASLEKNQNLAFEDLDSLVWDLSRSVTLDAVQDSLRSHGVYNWYSAEQLCKKFKGLEAEQAGKHNFFYKKNVQDLYVFHANMRFRYGSVVSNLILVSIALK